MVALLCPDPAGDHMIPDSVCQGKVVVASRGHIAILSQRVVKVTIELLLDLRDMGYFGNGSDRNLLPAISITARSGGHGYSSNREEDWLANEPANKEGEKGCLATRQPSQHQLKSQCRMALGITVHLLFYLPEPPLIPLTAILCASCSRQAAREGRSQRRGSLRSEF